MTRTTLAALAALLLPAPVLAGHANPWVTDEDTVNSQYHEENLARSEGTPGEDEMLGAMVREAHGKLDGRSGGKSRGKGD